MTPTQEHLFKLLLEIDDICKRNGIEFWLEYGTALGAVRHEGFIPWDNDLDISMTEENYDKFKQACARELDGTTRTFCDSRTDRDVPHVFGHYVDLTCCRMTQRTTFWKEYCGQVIDVFCHVALPRDIEENKRISNLFYAYDEYCNDVFPHYRRKTDDIYRLYEGMRQRGRKIGKEAVLREAEAEIFGHYRTDSDMWMCTSARMNWSVFWPRAFYENLKPVTFEGRTFHVASDWYEFMSSYYGDHFELYPEELRIHTEMSHTNIPSKVYVEDFTNATDLAPLLEDRRRAKELGLEEGYREESLKPPFYRLLGAVERHHVDERIAAEGIDVGALLDDGGLESVAVLEDLLGGYLAKQTHTSVLYWRAHLGASDLIDEACLYVLLVSRANVQALDRIIQVRTFNGLPVTDRMKRIQQAAHHVRDMKKHVHYGDLDEARRHIDWARANLPVMEEVEVWNAFEHTLRATGADAASDEDLAACQAEVEALRAAYPENDLPRKMEADIAFKRGESARAWALYDELAESTRDGFILLDIAKRRQARDRHAN